jgi:hypothetical protein
MAGIAIDELIALNSKRHIETFMNSAPVKKEKVVTEPEPYFDEAAFIKDVEMDFAERAEGLLETLQLSHLFVARKK